MRSFRNFVWEALELGRLQVDTKAYIDCRQHSLRAAGVIGCRVNTKGKLSCFWLLSYVVQGEPRQYCCVPLCHGWQALDTDLLVPA